MIGTLRKHQSEGVSTGCSSVGVTLEGCLGWAGWEGVVYRQTSGRAGTVDGECQNAHL